MKATKMEGAEPIVEPVENVAGRVTIDRDSAIDRNRKILLRAARRPAAKRLKISHFKVSHSKTHAQRSR